MKWHPDKNPQNTEMFKKISEAYETLIDSTRRQDYDDSLLGRGRGGFGLGTGEWSGPSAGRHSNYSSRRAFDLFESFFHDMDEMHAGMFNPFGGSFGDPVGGGDLFGRFGADPFSDPFFSSFGNGFSSQSMSTSSQVLRGGKRTGKSVSTSTSIDSSGRRVTRTETTTYHPDGRVETTVDENEDVAPGYNRIGGGNGGNQGRMPITFGASSSSHSNGRSGNNHHAPSAVSYSSTRAGQQKY